MDKFDCEESPCLCMVYSARCSKFTQLHGQAGIVLRYKQRYNFGENALTDLSFGAWLKRQRKASDLTQEQLADQVGCSAIAIRKIEAEERRPSAQIAERLAQIFNIPKNEQKTFRDFARGNIASAPKDTVKDIPWRATRVNLPATVTSLIGRAEELALIRDYLLDPNIRLITLIGPPGIGKTRLSLEAARTATIELTMAFSLPHWPRLMIHHSYLPRSFRHLAILKQKARTSLFNSPIELETNISCSFWITVNT